MSKKSSSASSGIGLTGLIFLLFLALKLIGIQPVASWSWWWVTVPLWAPVVVFIAGFIAYLSLVFLFSKIF